MTNSNGIQCVCFDAGGVVVRICRSWEEGCSAAGLPVRSAETRGQSAGARRRIIEAYQRGEIGCDEFATGISSALEGTYSPEEIMRVHRAWILGEYEGIGSTVERIHRAGLETTMLSNTNHAHWMQMHEAGRFPGFMAIRNRHASHLLGLHKPDVAIYAALAAKVGRRPSELIFFDDLPENVEAARGAGWHAVQIDPFGDPPEQVETALRERGFEI